MIRENKIQPKGFQITAIAFFIAVIAFTLDQYVELVQHFLKINYDWKFELLIVIGMLIFQYPFIYKYSWQKKLDYYFNMVLVSFIGAVLLSPLLVLNHYSTFSDTFNILYFFAVVLIMFLDHKRRVTNLNLSGVLSYSWVLYRFIILIFILK